MAIKHKSSKVKADVKVNRLYITIFTADKKTLEKVYTDVRFCVADLKPGFDVITDLSDCGVGYLNGIPTLRKIMDYLVHHQAGEIIRVVGEMSFIFKQLLLFSARISGYKPIYVNTLEQAEEKLTSYTRRKGLRFLLHQQQVEYTTNQEVGKGYLVDISVSGCAVREMSVPLTIGMEISMVIPFHHNREEVFLFTTDAKIVRIQDDLFAAQFFDLDDDKKQILYGCIIVEAQSEK